MSKALLALALLWPAAPAADEALSGETHEGVFIDLFETSLFEPCDSDERWWLEIRGDINAVFWARIKELRAAHEAQTGEPLGDASPPYFLTAKGKVSAPGAFGHLGQYNRHFDLTEIAEVRLATKEERIGCVTSGFFETLE